MLTSELERELGHSAIGVEVFVRLTDDLTSRHAIFLKGWLFLLLGLLASGSLLALHPGWDTAALLAIALWAFCRGYYFAFYVIERYVDPTYRFAGLGSFVRYLWRSRNLTSPSRPERGGKS